MGTIALLISDPVTADDHRIWIWSAVAKGARGINIYAYYPMSSGYEAGGYGLINLDGTLTERAINAGKIASIVDNNQDLFLSSLPVQAEIGIVYNPLSQIVGGMQRREYPRAHTNSLIGYFHTFSEHNVPVDFIHREHLERQDLSQYKLVIVPWPIMITREAADGLRAFVENGGYVLAEARIGWNDERGYASEIIPGLGLHEVFGVRENEVRMREDVAIEIVNNNHPATSGLEVGDVLKGTFYAKSVVPLKGRTIDILARLEDGSPTLVSSRYGKGEAMLIGSYLGLANHPDPVPENEAFFMNLLSWANVERPFTTSHDGNSTSPVEVILQYNDTGYVLFVINHSETSEDVTVDLRVEKDGIYFLHDVINNGESVIESENNKLRIPTSIDAKHVQIIRVHK